MNILKEEALADQGFYLRAFREFGFELAWSAVQSKEPVYRFFRLSYQDGRLSAAPLESPRLLQAIDQLPDLLPVAARAQLVEILRTKSFSPTRKKDILCHLHLDLLLVLVALKHDLSAQAPARAGLMEYLRRESPSEDLDARLFRVTAGHTERSNIHTFNKGSVLFDLRDSTGSRNLEALAPEQHRLIRSCEILRHLEISEGFEPAKLQTFLEELNRASSLIVEQFPLAVAHKVALKLRKIRRTKKQGLYIVATSTALVDPRHTDSLWHELGHWVHTWTYPQMKARPECEAYAEEFQSLVERTARTKT